MNEASVGLQPLAHGIPVHTDGMRIGLLGGSFNPPHLAHRTISLFAIKRLKLDRVWWLVTPGNPLKSLTGLAALKARMEAARRLDVGPRVMVSDIEAQIDSLADCHLASQRIRRYNNEAVGSCRDRNTSAIFRHPASGARTRARRRAGPRGACRWRCWRVPGRKPAARRAGTGSGPAATPTRRPRPPVSGRGSWP